MKSIMQIWVPKRLGIFYPLSNLKKSQANYTAVDLVSHYGYGKQLVIRKATSL
jgi:hypothetical protein